MIFMRRKSRLWCIYVLANSVPPYGYLRSTSVIIREEGGGSVNEEFLTR